MGFIYLNLIDLDLIDLWVLFMDFVYMDLIYMDLYGFDLYGFIWICFLVVDKLQPVLTFSMTRASSAAPSALGAPSSVVGADATSCDERTAVEGC